MTQPRPLQTGTTPPSDAVFTATDPLGRVVWMSAGRLAQKHYHDELKGDGLQHTKDAIESPERIARHSEFPDRRIYVGKRRPAPDISLVGPSRIVVVGETGTAPGSVITSYDNRKSAEPASVGAIEWQAPANPSNG